MKSDQDSHAKKRVLIVDDDRDTLSLLTFMFESLGLEVVQVASSIMAINDYVFFTETDGTFDFIALDIRMPNMDGNALAAHYRKLGFKGPIIAITATASEEGRQESLRSGFDAYLDKQLLSKDVIASVLNQ